MRTRYFVGIFFMVFLPEAKTQNGSDSLGEKIITVATMFLGKPYLRNPLDQQKEETLQIRLDGFDCYTFVETVLALARDSASFEKQIQNMRYRDGKIEDYASRIHYFTEWIYQNEKNRVIKDISPELPGHRKFAPVLDFMSRHRSSYPQLADDVQYAKIKAMEGECNKRTRTYLPKQYVPGALKFIKSGYIIAITTHKKGLDIAHVGFALWRHKKLYLIHASSDWKKVIISSRPLYDYLMRHKGQSGIMVLRPLD
ncbi:MAG: DUF1460 domain-containing protein [Saprospiraceae bacterium]|nr:DUF1460 domain-containing protein [Saprospiraceae bacterium]